VSLSLSPQLLNAGAWEKLMKAYHAQVIRGIQMDAQIRLEYYERRGTGLRGEKEQWDKTDEQQRSQRWGPTVTLTQQFDDKLGLAIWLHAPNLISTKQYFEENVPNLIRSYEDWAAKMREILASIEAAASRPDLPFFRLLTARLFDAALRGRDPEPAGEIQKLYHEWAGSAADLLRFEWRKKLRSLKARPEDLFTTHTTFGLFIFASGQQPIVIKKVEMIPYTLLDAKRSVALFDRDRGFMVVNDPSDFPQQPAQPPAGDVWQELLRKSSGPGEDEEVELAEQLRQALLKEPQMVSKQMISLLMPHLDETALSEDLKQFIKIQEQGLHKAAFTRHVNRADHAMDGRAILTTRENLDQARRAIPDLLKTWQATKEAASFGNTDESPAHVLETNQLECRLYLLMAIGECLAAGQSVKDYLPATFRSPQAGGSKPEIRDALSRAENADRIYAHGWIERLSHWGLDTAYSELMRGLPSEEEVTTPEEHAALLAFDVVELLGITRIIQEATAKLSQVQEKRASALVKLGPAIEAGLLMQAASTVHGDIIRLLEVLTGRQAAFGSGVER
jgi:hypothetical protein